MTATLPQAKPATDYTYRGRFSKARFRSEFETAFGKDPKYEASALTDAEKLLGFMEDDAAMTDIRWMAYVLATAYHETATLKAERVQVINKKGQKAVDKAGQPVMRTRRRWAITMAPVDEVGHGKNRDYFLPVKLRQLPEGEVMVTEQDGDQFKVKANGKFVSIKRGAKQGVDAGTQAVATYTEDTGVAQSYFGRGYVQLTWWSNYASTGAAIGRGLDLLLNPELVLEPGVAYKIMVHGMLTGSGFANGRKFSNYFHGQHTDYLGARAMVNGTDQREAIAKLAKQFEAALFASKDSALGAAK